MIRHFYLWVVAVVAITALVACGKPNPEKVFKAEMTNVAKDKFVSLEEQDTLDGLLKECKAGVKYPSATLKTMKDVIDYLEKVLGCDIEPLVKVKLNNLHILIENSLSMKGYFDAAGYNLTEPILALTRLECDSMEYSIAYVKAKPKSEDTEVVFSDIPRSEFESNLTGAKFQVGDSSPLDRILEASVNKIAPDGVEPIEDVFCLITDGILSGTNAEIVADREWTKKNLPVLENRIRRVFTMARKRHLHCLIYRFETSFDGSYYDYKNNGGDAKLHRINGDRPYFMIMVGHRDNLAKIDDYLKKEFEKDIKYTNRYASYEVTSMKTLTKATLKSKPKANGTLSGQTTIKYDAKKNEEPIEFLIQTNLNSLPDYYSNIDDLYSNTVISYEDKTAGVPVNIPYADICKEGGIEDVGNKVYRYTIKLAPEIVKNLTADGEMHLILRGHPEDWYTELSCNDDTNIESGDKRTFALNRFMGGIIKEYENQPNAIDFKFNVKKK